jgi:ubiquinone/menaquinone biosynthesis C-methylase UbiE
MTKKEIFIEYLLTEVSLEEVSEDIFSVLPKEDRASDYDDKVKGYDMLIGNKFYNQLIWKNDIKTYHTFCEQSLSEAPNGLILDAGCGSLVFTIQAYASATNKLIILLDNSMGMLQRARERLIESCGKVPEHIVLIQGDIFHLPFKDATFDVVMSQGLLHMFDDKEAFLKELERVKIDDGLLTFTSLAGNTMLAKGYLALLKKAGEVATAYTSEELETILQKMPFSYDINTIGNMAYMTSKKQLKD